MPEPSTRCHSLLSTSKCTWKGSAEENQHTKDRRAEFPFAGDSTGLHADKKAVADDDPAKDVAEAGDAEDTEAPEGGERLRKKGF